MTGWTWPAGRVRCASRRGAGRCRRCRGEGGTHGRLGRQHHLARCGRGTGGQLQGRGDGIVGHLQGQAVRDGGLGVEAHPEQQGGPGGLRPHAALQHPGGAAAGMDAELLKARVEIGVRTGDADVGGQREVESGADGGPVDRGDGGQRAVADRHEAVVDAQQALLGGRPERAEVGAGAEGLAGAGDDQRVHAGVGLGLLDRGAQLRRHRVGDRVAPVGIVDGDQRDAVGDGVKHQLRTHGGDVTRGGCAPRVGLLPGPLAKRIQQHNFRPKMCPRQESNLRPRD